MKQYTYHVNLNERGSFYADVRNEQGDSVYDVKGGNELEEGQTSLVEDGFMRNFEDVNGLCEYLRQMSVIEPDAVLVEVK